ncbi:MAG: hypothetical protein COA85_00465 [Robiginitomaculum sp.]|nr:MAG: hypothetical protein COA85_00465 [Robiginitomaculum sp.]
MAIPANKMGQLQALFSVLSEKHRQTLVMTIMAAKADGEAKLPYDDLLTLLGGGEAQEERWEEIFTVVKPLVVEKVKRCDQISATLLHDIWEYYFRELDPVRAAAWLSGKENLADIREAMVSTYQGLTETKKGHNTLIKKFGEDEQGQLSVLLSLMNRSDELEDFFSGWPHDIKNLDDENLAPLREFNEHLIVDSPEITPYILFLVTTRLLHPFHIFRAVEKVTGHSNDRVMIKTELKVMGDALLDQNDIWLGDFQWERNQKCNIDQSVASLKGFIDLTNGWLSEFEVDPAGPWGKRLSAQRSRCGKVWDEHMQRIQKNMDRILPRKRGSVTGRQTMPDIRKDIIENDVVLAENAITLLLGARSFASQGGFQSSRDKLVQMLESRIEEQSEDLLALLGQERADYEQISAHFAVLVRIVKRYLGDKDADVLARRSVVAMAA